jgi:hypothetical protein
VVPHEQRGAAAVGLRMRATGGPGTIPGSASFYAASRNPHWETDMLKALLVGTALMLATAAPSLAQNTQPSQRPTTPPAATQPLTQPAQQGTQAPTRLQGSHLIGLTLRNSANESIGSIDDVLVDPDGRVRQVVVSVGGFLGIGDRKVAIAWDQLRFDAAHNVAMVNLTKDQVRAMPEYRAN